MNRKFYNLIVAAILAFVAVFQVEAQTPPTTSTTGNDVWYFIQCKPRDTTAPNAKWLTGNTAGGILTNTVLTTDPDQLLWKVVANADGIALVNKKFGTYMNADQAAYGGAVPIADSKISCVTDAPSKGLKLWPYVDQTATSAGVPGGFYLVNSDAVTPIVNAANASLTFQFYSAGSGFNSPINYGANSPNINSSMKFLTSKDLLQEAISLAYAGYDNSSEGLNPGQYSSDDRDALYGTIMAEYAIFNNAASTDAEIIAAVFEMNAVFTQFKATVILPEVSNDNNIVWYYIQGTRPANSYMTAPAAGAGTQVKDLPVIPDETQLWKLVSNGDGFALQNKASLEYLQSDFPTGTNLNTQSAKPTKALRFITSNETFNKAFRFWIENTTSSTEAYRLHAGGSGNGWGLMNWTGDANDNCTWLFLSENELFRTQLLVAKTNAHDLYVNTTGGLEFGQYNTVMRTAFNTVLTTEDAKNVGTMTKEELLASTKAYTDAMAAYTCNTEVNKLASVTQTKWFRLVNVARTGKAMSSIGRIVDQKFTFVPKDTTSEEQLFSFELNANGTQAISIVNKTNGLFMNTDGMMVAAAPATEFAINALDAYSFEIRPAGKAPLHGEDGTYNIVNWESGAGSASAWKFEFVKAVDITDFSAAYLAKRIQMRTKANSVDSIAGDQMGQYLIASVNAFKTVVAAEEAKNAATLTQEQMKQGLLDLNAASSGLVINTDIKLLKSSNANSYKWFRLINNMSGTGYASGKAMSSNGRLKGEAFTWEDRDITSDAQLFRFNLTTDETQVASIVNKGNGMYVTAEGKIDSISTAGNNFEITQLSGGRSFWIDPTAVDTDPLHAAGNTNILNWLDYAGSASAWLFEFVKEEATALKNVTSNKYDVRAANGLITVAGVENFDVYSITGQKQNHKAPLMAGVYIVKVNGYVKKVMLK